MPLRQLTTEVKNQLQLTTEVPSTVKLTADEKRKKKKEPRHLSDEELINFVLNQTTISDVKENSNIFICRIIGFLSSFLDSCLKNSSILFLYLVIYIFNISLFNVFQTFSSIAWHIVTSPIPFEILVKKIVQFNYVIFKNLSYINYFFTNNTINYLLLNEIGILK